MNSQGSIARTFKSRIVAYVLIAMGALLAAFSIEVFLIPNNLIDGGIVGIGMMLGHLFGHTAFPVFLLICNIPFVYLAYRYIGKSILLHMLYAVIVFVIAVSVIYKYLHFEFEGESLEVVVIGGCILGIGLGLIIRYGGCLDGTEILGIIINKETGITVGQTVLFCNIFIFAAAGLVFQDWHSPILSLITYMVVIKVMDGVIVGLDETKSVIIITAKPDTIAKTLMTEMELGLTILYGRGGYSGVDKEILYVICERLQLSELKEIVHQEDPAAFIAIENLHEVASGNAGTSSIRSKKRVESLVRRMITGSAKKA